MPQETIGHASKGNKPFTITLAAAAVMTLSSHIRWAVTGSIRVDENYLSGLPMAVNVILVLGSLAAAGVAFVKILLRREGYDLDLRQVRKLAVAAVLISFFMMPMLSNDIFSGLAYGDLALRGVNPYTHAEMLETSRFASYLGPAWIHAPCVYGPVSLLLAAAAALAGRISIPLALAVFKLLALGCALLFIETAFRFFRDSGSGRGVNGAALVLLSPLLWVQGSGQAHNDLTAAALLMTALYLLRRRHFIVASFPLVLAVHAKSSAALALLLYVLLVWLGLRSDKKRLVRTIGASLGIGIVCTAALWAPFWDGPRSLSEPARFLSHKEPSKSLTAVVAEAAAYTERRLSPHSAKPPAAPGHSSPFSVENVGLAVRGLSLLLALYVLSKFRKFRGSNESIAGFAALATIVICFFSPVFQPWYLLAVLPLFAGVERWDWVIWAGAVFSYASAMNVVHIMGVSSAASRVVLPFFVLSTIALFFWRFRARFLAA